MVCDKVVCERLVGFRRAVIISVKEYTNNELTKTKKIRKNKIKPNKKKKMKLKKKQNRNIF